MMDEAGPQHLADVLGPDNTGQLLIDIIKLGEFTRLMGHQPVGHQPVGVHAASSSRRCKSTRCKQTQHGGCFVVDAEPLSHQATW